MLIQSTLQQPYHPDSWRALLQHVFPEGSYAFNATPVDIPVAHPQVESTRQIGRITLPGDGKTLALLVIETADQVMLARNRVALRQFVGKFIDEAETHAVLAVFHQPSATGSDDWRLTFATRQTSLDEDTFLPETTETAPRRYTFLLGPEQPHRTPTERLAKILQRGDALTLEHVEEAFSVEALSKDFFKRYQEHYQAFVDELLPPTEPETPENGCPTVKTGTRSRFGIPELADAKAQEKADKPVRDFVKKLLGRLIFLHFLQKKGWLGVPADAASWSEGDRDFLRHYFQHSADESEDDTFHSRYLAPLFFTALNTRREGDLFEPLGMRIPYLNGGLFDADDAALQAIDFPSAHFEELFAFFAEYNFTIDENDPEDHEVGIDPEMLGHIFENLLEDNKDKGAYYTPKAIVAYMCRQSLLHYLRTHLPEEGHPAITALVEQHDPEADGGWAKKHAKDIATLLEKVKICDPAIGSGAFPIGMLNEIVHLRTLLNSELNDPAERAALKKRIIQQSIYGVDLDAGAVDIARLRFWLALVVDEEEPSPLPNLDYRIMQGNSLLESFEGIDLSQLHSGNTAPRYAIREIIGSTSGQDEMDLLDDAQQEFRTQSEANVSRLLERRREYFDASGAEEKERLRREIDREVQNHIQISIETALDNLVGRIDQHEKITAGILPKPARWPRSEKAIAKKMTGLLAEKAQKEAAADQLEGFADQNERPFFLWHLFFQDVFEDGGFDIVIANPPYVRHEKIRDLKPLLQQEGYETYVGTADLYVYFYEQALNLLRPKGVISFISSNKYFRADYGKKLRTLLSTETDVKHIIDFRDEPVFNGVVAYASILITRKSQEEPTIVNTLVWQSDYLLNSIDLEIKRNRVGIPHAEFTADIWIFVPRVVFDLLENLKEEGRTLEDSKTFSLHRGITTGLNTAYVVDEKFRDYIESRSKKELEYVVPYYSGKLLGRWSLENCEHKFLVKIESSKNFTHSWSNSSEPEAAFEVSAPEIYSHFQDLSKLKNSSGTDLLTQLKNRDDQGQFFWELRSCTYWDEFSGMKIVSTKVSDKPTFAIDYGYSIFANTAYFFKIDPSEKYLASCLNSSVFHFYALFKFVEKENDFFEIQPKMLEKFPIPPATETEKSRLAELAEACAEAATRDDQSALAPLEAEIDRIVYGLFDLTETEIALIEETVG